MRTQGEFENKAIAPRRRYAFEGIESAVAQPPDPVTLANPKPRELLEAERNVLALEAELAAARAEQVAAEDDLVRRIGEKAFESHVNPATDPAVRRARERVAKIAEVVTDARIRRGRFRQVHSDTLYRARLDESAALQAVKLEARARTERRARSSILARGLARLRELTS